MITLSLPSGSSAQIHPRGATLHALSVPDRDGRLGDILAAPEIAGGGPRLFMGATVGRYANRIAGATFSLDGQQHRLVANDGPHCLHGGANGFDRRLWDVEARRARSVTLTLVSPEGDQGFPGRMEVAVTYDLSEQAGAVLLDITMTATTDAACPVSLTNHAYFNLGGVDDPAAIRAIDDHVLTVNAARYLPVTAEAIPLPDAPAPVEGTPFDLRGGPIIAERLRAGDPQLLAVRGLDHCFCLDGDGRRLAAELGHPASGRVMRMWTDQPGLQVYTGNWLDGTARGKAGAAYRMGDAICLEPGAWPDAPNRPDFPNTVLRPDQNYLHRMTLEFPRPA